MITVLFFAKLREQLGCERMQVALEPGDTLQTVRERIAVGDGFAPLLADNIIVAVNQTVAAWDAAVSEGDEVAFFPPVTGG